MRRKRGENAIDTPPSERKVRFQAEAYNEVKAEAAGRALTLREVEQVLELARQVGATDDTQLKVMTTLWGLHPKEIIVQVVK